MAGESSFDVVSKVDRQEVDNALNQAAKEIAQRYDFKGVGASIAWSGETIVLVANSADRVRAVLDVPALAGQTVVPRLSLVVINGDDYVFVRKAADGLKEKRFERRKVTVAQENSDFVIIHNGLQAGEEVVTSGSLILAQLYEDLQMVNTGTPPL